MFKLKLIKLIILSSLIPTVLIGCSSQTIELAPSNSQENVSNSIEKNSAKQEIEKAYNKLLEEYKKFADYIYEIDQDNLSSKGLGNLTKTLKQENTQELSKLENELFATFNTQFTTLIDQINQFKETINQSSIDDKQKQDILNQFKGDQDQDLWLMSSQATQFMGYFSDEILDKNDICSMQADLNINVQSCGIFGDQTYTKLEEILRTKTIELGDTLTKINTLIANISEPNPTPQLNTNSNSVEIPLWLLTTFALGFLITSSVSVISVIILFFNRWNKTHKENKQLKELLERYTADTDNEKIQETQNLESSSRQENSYSSDTSGGYYNNLLRRQRQQSLSRSRDTLTGNTIENEKTEAELTRNPEIDSSSTSKPTTNYTPLSPKLNSVDFDSQNPQNFRNFAQQNEIRTTEKVTIPQITQRKVWDGSLKTALNLECNKNGEYLVIITNQQYDYVIPNPDTKFNPQTLKIIKKSELFTGINDTNQTIKGRDIEVIKQAKVRKNGEYWILLESGELIL